VPSIVVIASGPSSREELTAAIQRRFGADYSVVALDGSEVSSETIGACGPIAIALAPIGSAEFAAMNHVAAHQAGARRIAVVRVGDTSVAQALSQALTLGHVDYYVGQPWASPEEELYPVMSEALRVWADEKQLRFEKVTIVGERERSRGVALATMLTRNGVTTRLLGCDSQEALDLMAGPLAGLALPAVRLWDGRVLAAPTEAELAEALGAHTSPTATEYDVAIVGAGPAGFAAAIYASSEGLRAVTVEATAVGGQAGTSAHIRNYRAACRLTPQGFRCPRRPRLTPVRRRRRRCSPSSEGGSRHARRSCYEHRRQHRRRSVLSRREVRSGSSRASR
jgi:thioredoxin reductase (NADPH)